MKLIDKLERKFGKYSIKNLTYYLIAGQVFAFLLIYSNVKYSDIFVLQGNLLLDGQWWRILTFLFEPITTSIIFAAFIWYAYYMFGSVLEKQWGSFRYLLFLLVAYIGTVTLSFIFPQSQLTNGYIYLSVFLVFAYLYPNYKLYIFFIIPVKAKWLAALSWIGIFIALLTGSIPTKVLTLVSIGNFLLFFGKDLLTSSKYKARSVSRSSSNFIESKKAHHICAVCGKNEKDNPDMEIRYCSTCVPTLCYCENHIRNHNHKIIN